MNYQRNNKFFILIGLTLLLLITSIVLITIDVETRGVLIIFLPMIIIMVLISVFLSVLQINKIKEHIANLPENYKSAYLDANELLVSYGLLKVDKQEIMNMILEIFEHSSLEGRDVDEVIGKDISSFVEGFITEAGKTNLLLSLFGYSTALFIGYLLLIKAYEVIRSGTISLKTLQSGSFDLGLLVTYFIIAYICVPWLILSIQRSTKYKWRGVKRMRILIPVFIPIGIFACLVLSNDLGIVKITEMPIHLFTNIWSVGIGILLLISSLFLTRIQKKQ